MLKRRPNYIYNVLNDLPSRGARSWTHKRAAMGECPLLTQTGRCGPPHSASGIDPELTLALPREVEHWSLTKLREKLIKIGAKVVRHGRYVTFQLAEVAIPRRLFAEILQPINGLRPKPAPT